MNSRIKRLSCQIGRSWALIAALAVGVLGGSPLCAQGPPAPTAFREAVPLTSTVAPGAVQDADGLAQGVAVVQSAPRASSAGSAPSPSEPAGAGWAADAVFYQIFPERFCNGDPANDPTRESLDGADIVPESWHISPWTGDWYEPADWERQMTRWAIFQRRYGGDLQGVINRLDYLRVLGINAIYLNPVFYGRSLHKYDGSSFHHIDPYFGPDPAGDLALIADETRDPASWHWTAADKLFLELVRRAHARGIRVVIDGVFNHTGRGFFAFDDLLRNQTASPYKDWYVVESFDDPATPENEFRYRGWWGNDSLPEFADNAAGDDLHPGPKGYVLDITARWMDPNQDGDPSDGIDGWRLDVAQEVPLHFWSQWNDYVRTINPNAYTVAEDWDEAGSFVKEGKFSSTMNYYAFAFPVKAFFIDKQLTQNAAINEFNQRRDAFPLITQYDLLNLVDSHDTARIASIIVNADRPPYVRPERFDYDLDASQRRGRRFDLRKPNAEERRIQRMIALMQMTYVGPPMIYYGTEAGMWGPDDPGDRQPMVWPGMKFDPQQIGPPGGPRKSYTVEFDRDLYAFYRAAAWLRRQHSALRRGTIQFLDTDGEAEFLAFRRSDATETLLVGLNRGDAEYPWQVPLEDGQSVTQVFTASGNIHDFPIQRNAQGAMVTIPPRDGVVLAVTRDE